jgi:divalent metal cation (Fe/Co/Zn/Cd) transporter
MTEEHRAELVGAALRISWFSVVWSMLAGIAALISGVAAGSLALVGFGLDSVIDSSASVVLVWRFSAESNDEARAERVERVAGRFVGGVLAAVALYIIVESARALAGGSGPENTAVGDTIAVASVLVLPGVAWWKLRLSAGLGSRALRGDGVLTAAGAVLALVTLVALILNNAFDWWWADSVAALAIALLLATEAARSLRPGENV